MSRILRWKSAAIASVLLAAWPAGLVARAADDGGTNAAATAAPATNAAQEVVYYSYQIVHTFPHDPNAFTQGLVFQDGKLLESTGLYGESSLRAVELNTGNVLQQTTVPREFFAEGLALLGDKLYQLTWQNGKGFVYDLKTFAKEKEFTYAGEGWGLTTDGHWLIMSDGTSIIRFLDPETFKVDHSINVLLRGNQETNLNELEYIHGEIFANIWRQDFVARIDPATGRVTGMIDFSNLLPLKFRGVEKVLNGIAYDPAGDRLFVTGKLWPELYEVRLKKR
jgi:glutamine cyclotransferase